LNHYLIFGLGMFVGFCLGFIMASLRQMAHKSDQSIDEAEQWARLKKKIEDRL